jgi:hypothetical protein
MATRTMNRGVTAPAAADPGDEAAALVLGSGRQESAGEADQGVVLELGVLVAVAVQLDGRPDEQELEDQEHEREQLEQGGADGDEDGPHDQGEHDPEGERLLLVLSGGRRTCS